MNDPSRFPSVSPRGLEGVRGGDGNCKQIADDYYIGQLSSIGQVMPSWGISAERLKEVVDGTWQHSRDMEQRCMADQK